MPILLPEGVSRWGSRYSKQHPLSMDRNPTTLCRFYLTPFGMGRPHIVARQYVADPSGVVS